MVIEKLYIQLKRPLCSCKDSDFDVVLDPEEDTLGVVCQDCGAKASSEFKSFAVEIVWKHDDGAPKEFKN